MARVIDISKLLLIRWWSHADGVSGHWNFKNASKHVISNPGNSKPNIMK